MQNPNPWKITYAPTLYVQNENRKFDGDQTVQGLENLLNTVITAIDTYNGIDRTLMGSVDIIKAIDINPYQLNIDESNIIFSYEIVINAERRKN